MSYYYWPEEVTASNEQPFNPMECYDIKDERYLIPNHVVECSLAELVKFPYVDISTGSLLNVCSAEEYWDTHCKNSVIISGGSHCFHSQTFEEVKAQSPLIHNYYGLSAHALVALANTLRLHDGESLTIVM